jgi:hypothetical protein
MLGNLFSVKNSDGSLNKATIAGWITGFLGVLAATPGGPELIGATLSSLGPYAPAIVALVSFLGGAAANTKPQ